MNVLRTIFFLVATMLIFARCGVDGTQDQNDEVSSDIESDSVKTEIYSDTVYSFTDEHDFEFNGPQSSDTVLFIHGKKYRLHLGCELLNNQRVKTVDKFGSDGKLHIQTYIGYQAHYRIALYEGDRKIFNRSLKKEDFEESIYSIVIESDAHLPELVSYNDAFKSLVFHVPFYIDGSCWSTNALLVMDLNGKVKFVDALDVPMGNSSNFEVQFSPSKKHIVSGAGIYHADGKYIDLGKKSSSLMGIDVFSNCLLVVYAYDEDEHKKNAYLMDYEGKTLLNFRYEGWTGGLGYHFPFKKVHGSYYFIDEMNKRLIRISKTKTWSYQFLPFAAMREFNDPLKPGEIPFTIQSEITDYHFFLDIRSNKLRKRTPVNI